MLERQQIIRAFSRLSDLLKERNVDGEVCLLGGTVMVLAFKARASTKDVDAIFSPTQVIRELARVIQEEQQLPENWINDGAKGFVSERHETIAGDLPQFENLRLTMPTPEYLLAMKCLASRISTGETDRGDVADIRFLIHYLNLKTTDDVLSIVQKYYPPNQLPVRAQFLIEDIFNQSGDER
jgi:hypothetical protein